MHIDRDIRYAMISPAQRLDLFRPVSGAPRLPLVVAIHGGAFKAGDKSSMMPIVNALVANGYAVASLNYRLSGEAVFPAAIQDAKAAVRWLRVNSADYGLDPGRFGAIGESAGAYLATTLGTSGELSLPGDADLGNADTSGAVQAVVHLYGPVNFATMDDQLRATPPCGPGVANHDGPNSPESLFLGRPITEVPDLVRAANPITYLGRAPIPPFYIEHGAADCTVPAGQSEELAAALNAAGGPAPVVSILPGAGHGPGYPLASRLPGIIAFFDRTLRS